MTIRALPNMLKAGAMIFKLSKHAVDTYNSNQWWTFKFGGRLDRVSRGAVLRESAA
jgi:hypothetical protein